MKNYTTSDEILLDKLKTFTLRKNENYAKQIERSLKVIAEVWQSSTPLQPYQYDIVEQYNDVVIAELKEGGIIEVNQK